LHRIVPEFDAGAILSKRERRLPDDLSSDTIMSAWFELLVEALDEGVPRAARGEPGEPQDETLATYAAPFTQDERWLRWDEPALAIQRRAAALNVLPPFAHAYIDGQPMHVSRICAGPRIAPTAVPGTVLSQAAETFIIRVADGTVEVTATPLDASEMNAEGAPVFAEAS
jgi:methionyl-tRNA formyltransferase